MIVMNEQSTLLSGRAASSTASQPADEGGCLRCPKIGRRRLGAANCAGSFRKGEGGAAPLTCRAIPMIMMWSLGAFVSGALSAARRRLQGLHSSSVPASQQRVIFSFILFVGTSRKTLVIQDPFCHGEKRLAQNLLRCREIEGPLLLRFRCFFATAFAALLHEKEKPAGSAEQDG